MYHVILLVVIANQFVHTQTTTCPNQCESCNNGKLKCYRKNMTSSDVKVLVNNLGDLSSNAVSLSLVGNKLKSFPTEYFVNFTLLKQLELSDNLLESYPQNLSTYLPKLSKLVINNNNLRHFYQRDLIGYENINTIDIYGNALGPLGDDVFKYAPNVWNLFMEKSGVTSIAPTAFKSLKSLARLSLYTNPINELSVETFAGLTKLTTVYLDDIGIKELPVGLFKDLKSLKKLLVSKNSISELKPGLFDNLNALNIDLTNNSIANINKNAFQNTIIHRNIDLAGNPLICDCHMYELYELLRSKSSGFTLGGTCETPSLFKDQSVNDVNLGNLLNCTMCTYNPCSNNASCQVSSKTDYTCLCPYGFTGKNCEKEIICAFNHCKNNGSCFVYNETAGSCNCTEEFKGEICEIQKVCTPNPCHHNASCIEVSDYEYSCNCSHEYEGKDCEMLKGGEDKDKKGLAVGWIILIVLVSVALVALVIIGIAYRRKYSKDKTERTETQPLRSVKT